VAALRAELRRVWALLLEEDPDAYADLVVEEDEGRPFPEELE
jgi:hypothetical protein